MSTLSLILGSDANTDAGRVEIGAQSQFFTTACDLEARDAAFARVGTAVNQDGRISRHVPEPFTMNPTGRLATSVAHAAALPVQLTVRRQRAQAAGAVLPPAFGGAQPGDGAAAGPGAEDIVIDLMPLHQTWADNLRLGYWESQDPAELSGALGAALTHAHLRRISLREI